MKPTNMIHLAQKLTNAVLLSALLATSSASAYQLKDADEGIPVHGFLSLNEPSRIAVDGAKIRRVLKVDGEFTDAKDEETGAVFITPTTPKPLNIFVLDDQNHTYQLLLQPKDVPSENIVIRDRKSGSGRSAAIEKKTTNYHRLIKNMVLALATDDRPAGIDIADVFQEVPIWNEARLVLHNIYRGRSMAGERYSLTNISNAPMVLQEQEFSRKGVLAVSIENMNLAPGESTNVYVVREKSDHE